MHRISLQTALYWANSRRVWAGSSWYYVDITSLSFVATTYTSVWRVKWVKPSNVMFMRWIYYMWLSFSPRLPYRSLSRKQKGLKEAKTSLVLVLLLRVHQGLDSPIIAALRSLNPGMAPIVFMSAQAQAQAQIRLRQQDQSSKLSRNSGKLKPAAFTKNIICISICLEIP